MIHDPGYLCRIDELRWYPWTIDAVRLLNRAGFLVFVTTNQGGVGLGLYEEAFVHAVHGAMTARLTAGGARIDGWFYCMHHPNAVIDGLRADCDCRKPRPGMVAQAEQRFPVDRARSFVVGDKMSDVGLAASIGATGVLVRTGHGEEEAARHEGAPGLSGVEGPAIVTANLMEATAWILGQRA